MSRIFKIGAVMCALLVAQALTSCLHRQPPELTLAKDELIAVQVEKAKLEFPANSYEYFVSTQKYPVTMRIFKNTELLAKANGSSRVVICLAQQRGRLYVDGQVAADWPVSTGISGRETPAGNYKVLEKKEKYASNRYGKMYNAEGKCINGDADAVKHEVPEGGRFEGSPMPYWQRLTSDGVGMHIGKVAAGKRLSHGCIRTPGEMARELFRITRVGTRVTVSKELESEFPAMDALNRGEKLQELETRERELQQKIYDMTMAMRSKKH